MIRKLKIIALLTISSTTVTVAITTLVIMAHGHRWASLHDELIATPITVAGFIAALACFIAAICIPDSKEEIDDGSY